MSDTTRPQAARVAAPACPICARPPQARYRPFCSKRCADVDLHRWLGEHYRVPTDEPSLDDDPDAGRG